MTTGRGDGQTAQYKICTLAYDFHFPLPISRRNRAAQNSVKRGAADTPSAKPVLNIHILLFHTPHPQRNGVRALCSGAVSRLPAGKEYKLEFVGAFLERTKYRIRVGRGLAPAARCPNSENFVPAAGFALNYGTGKL